MDLLSTQTVAEYIIEQLSAWGVTHIFGLPGDSVIPLFEALRKQDRIRFIGVRNEENAAFMASAWAKLTGKLGVCLGDGGPGTVHLLVGGADAQLDRVPVLAVCGHLKSDEIGTGYPQDIDQAALWKSAAVYSRMVHNPKQAIGHLTGAIRAALLKKGLTSLIIPVDLQARRLSAQIRLEDNYLGSVPEAEPRELAEAAHLLDRSGRPAILIGRGARGAAEPILEIAEKVSAAVFHTIPGSGIIDDGHPKNLGVVGEAGRYLANRTFGEADVILIVGSAWSQAGYLPSLARVIQIDQDRDRIGRAFPVDVGLVGKAKETLILINHRLRYREKAEWGGLVRRRKAELEGTRFSPLGASFFGPGRFLEALGRMIGRKAVVAIEAGPPAYFFGNGFPSTEQEILISGNYRAPGAALPAAIAARLAYPGRQVVSVSTSEAFVLSMMEFTTAVKYRLPVKAFVLRSRQDLVQGGTNLGSPDLARFARACGGDGFKVSRFEEYEGTIKAALESQLPALVEVLDPSLPEEARY